MTSKEEYDVMFKKDYELLNINYDEQMIIVYFYNSFRYERKFLYSIELIDEILTIKFSPKYTTKSLQRGPYDRYFVVIMDKIECSSVEFINLRY